MKRSSCAIACPTTFDALCANGRSRKRLAAASWSVKIIGNSLRTRESIRYGESEGKTFHEIIEAATTYGWHSFDHCLLKAFEANEVTEETALMYCNDKGRVRRELDLLDKRHGHPEVETMSALRLDVVANPKSASGVGVPPSDARRKPQKTALRAVTAVSSSHVPRRGAGIAGLGNDGNGRGIPSAASRCPI
jgi:hypothetical protein